MANDYASEATYSATVLGGSSERLTGYTGLWTNLVGLETGTAITTQPTVTERFAGLYTFTIDWSTINSTTYSGVNSGSTISLGEDLAGTLDFGKRATATVDIKTAAPGNLTDDELLIRGVNDTDGGAETVRKFKYVNQANSPWSSGEWKGAKLIILADSASSIVGKTFVFTNTDGTTHTITGAALGSTNPSTATQFNTDDVGNANDMATELKESIDAAIAAGSLKMQCGAITNSTAGAPRVITLFQNEGGLASEKAVSGTLIDSGIVKINVENPASSNGDLKFLDGDEYVAINVTGLTTMTSIATQTKTAIEHANGLAGKVSASVGAEAGGKVPITLTQYFHGSGGNKNNTTSDATNVAITNFTGGITLADSLRYKILHLQRTDIGFSDILEDTAKLIDVQLGKWEIVSNQLVLYKVDGVTVLKTFNLQDKNGQATSVSPYKRIPV